ncbi:hypothetical protein K470DRAFT_125450 [Piedraia hortae CBS 480.64]|uniref:Uncharacterized protein n=1 Tax=Piedraia hortae CBS 480.64 TaxID=1314780 RepID=A0A6A7C7K7_9PEZI|nr:hypothetical protein K470DRAFT_125450 [Piedraia hortae CBS 480.64]
MNLLCRRLFHPSPWRRIPSKPVNAPPPPSKLYRAPSAPTERLFQCGPEVLIYRAASNRGYAAFAIVGGSMLLLGAANWAFLLSNITKESEGWTKHLTSLTAGATTVFLGAMGTAMILGPCAVVRSITARAPAKGKKEPLLLIRTQATPFSRVRTWETQPHDTFIDGRVAGNQIDYTSLTLDKATAAATDEVNVTARPSSTGNAVPQIVGHVRRLFYREGVAHLRMGQRGKTWRLNLASCEMLQGGMALEQLSKQDRLAGTGPVAWLKRSYLVT